MEEPRYCEECGTLNEAEFKYCKNCGSPLQQQSDPDDIGSDFERSQSDGSVDGVSTQDMIYFVGKRGEKVVRKWSEMSFFRRRFSWCWPAFIWSWFFGLAGAGFWFLYRRMYRLGALLIAASFALSAAGILAHSDSITGIVIDSVDCIKQSTDLKTGYVDENELSLRFELLAEGEDAKTLSAYSETVDMVNLMIAVIAGLFALSAYKIFAVRKIKSYSRELTPLELSLAGGTSGGALSLGIILSLIAELSVLVMVIMGAFA